MKRNITILSVIAAAAMVGIALPATAQNTPGLPQIEGPIAEQWGNQMHPGIFFPGNRPYLSELPDIWSLEYHGYVAEEFFLTGEANGQPYTTRLVIRRPADVEDWSGFTLLEVQHTAGAAQTWMSSRVGGMTNGHAYVELVERTGAANNLRALNGARYANIAVPEDEVETQNAIVAQAALLLRTAHPSGSEWNADPLVITGSSQTAGASRNYMEGGQQQYQDATGAPLFDGMFVYSVNGPSSEQLAEFYDVPVIVVSTEDEWNGTREEWGPDQVAAIPEDGDLYRLYQVAGMPHLEARHYFAADPAICERPLDHFMFSAPVFLGVQSLYNWIVNDLAPPSAERIQFEADGTIARDSHGNAMGGLRTPQLDVPTHSWNALNEGNQQCSLAGVAEFLPAEQLAELYSTPGNYAHQLRSRTLELIEEGWFPIEYLFEIEDEIGRFATHAGNATVEEDSAP